MSFKTQKSNMNRRKTLKIQIFKLNPEKAIDYSKIVKKKSVNSIYGRCLKFPNHRDLVQQFVIISTSDFYKI